MVWWLWGPSRMEMELSKLSNHTLLTLRALIDGEITDRMMTGVLDDNDNVEREIDAMDGSARSSEESSPPRPLSHLGNLVRRMGPGQLDQRLQQPTSSSRADLRNPMRGLPNEDENDRASEAAVAAAKRESYTDTRTKAVIAEDHADRRLWQDLAVAMAVKCFSGQEQGQCQCCHLKSRRGSRDLRQDLHRWRRLHTWHLGQLWTDFHFWNGRQGRQDDPNPRHHHGPGHGPGCDFMKMEEKMSGERWATATPQFTQSIPRYKAPSTTPPLQ